MAVKSGPTVCTPPRVRARQQWTMKTSSSKRACSPRSDGVSKAQSAAGHKWTSAAGELVTVPGSMGPIGVRRPKTLHLSKGELEGVACPLADHRNPSQSPLQ